MQKHRRRHALLRFYANSSRSNRSSPSSLGKPGDSDTVRESVDILVKQRATSAARRCVTATHHGHTTASRPRGAIGSTNVAVGPSGSSARRASHHRARRTSPRASRRAATPIQRPLSGAMCARSARASESTSKIAMAAEQQDTDAHARQRALFSPRG
jgi:hypothetical protein